MKRTLIFIIVFLLNYSQLEWLGRLIPRNTRRPRRRRIRKRIRRENRVEHVDLTRESSLNLICAQLPRISLRPPPPPPPPFLRFIPARFHNDVLSSYYKHAKKRLLGVATLTLTLNVQFYLYIQATRALRSTRLTLSDNLFHILYPCVYTRK